MRKLLVVILILAFASAAAAAGGRAEQMRETDEQDMKISVHLGAFGEDIWKQMIDLFEERNPGVSVELEISPTNFESLRLQYLSGRDLPDFHQAPTWSLDYQTLQEEGMLFSYEDILQTPSPYGEGTFEELLLPSTLEIMRHEGNLYLMPFSLGSNGLWYDEKLFRDKNWSVPTNFEEFLEFGEKALAEGIAPFTYTGVHDYIGFILYPTIASIGGVEAVSKLNNLEEGAFTQDAVVEMLKRVETLRDRGMIQHGALGFDHIESQTELALRRAATVVSGDWIWVEMRDAWPDDFELGFMGNPLSKAGEQRCSWMHLLHVSVPRDASNPELGAEFAKFMFDGDVMDIWAREAGVVRPIVGADAFTDYLFDAKRVAIDYLTAPDNLPVFVAFPYSHRELHIEFMNHVDALVEGVTTIDRISRDMEASLRRARAER